MDISPMGIVDRVCVYFLIWLCHVSPFFSSMFILIGPKFGQWGGHLAKCAKNILRVVRSTEIRDLGSLSMELKFKI